MEKLPYLLQHTHNPVDWFPWSDEAFAKAKMEDKPVFLSETIAPVTWWQSGYYNQYKLKKPLNHNNMYLLHPIRIMMLIF